MKRLLLLPLLVLALWSVAQTDSTTLKLQQYKTLYEQGTINKAEYDELKAKLLNINSKPTTIEEVTEEPADADKSKKTEHRRYFNFRVVPLFYGAVAQTVKDPYTNFTGKVSKSYSGGVHLEAGPVIKNKHSLNVALGFELDGRNRFQMPAYAHYHVSFFDKKISPYMHVGLGYVLVRYVTTSPDSKIYNGFIVPVGVGASFRLHSKVYMAVSTDYRLLGTVFEQVQTDYNGTELNRKYFQYVMSHQLGLRVQFIFH